MTTKHSITALLTILLLLCESIVTAQETETYFSVSGVVRDARSKRTIGGVNISATGTSIGTITNEDGEFVFKLIEPLTVKEIELSCVGYINTKISISKDMQQNQTFFITPQAFLLSEVEVFSWRNPRDLIELALDKVVQNYSEKPNMLIGFYRETIQKRRNFIHISEAVIQVYKTPYRQNVNFDRSQVLKGRSLVSPKKSDTLDIKFLGGPNMPVYIDIVKNPDVILSREIGRAHV